MRSLAPDELRRADLRSRYVAEHGALGEELGRRGQRRCTGPWGSEELPACMHAWLGRIGIDREVYPRQTFAKGQDVWATIEHERPRNGEGDLAGRTG